MKLLKLFAAVALSLCSVSAAQLEGVKTIYILPMSGGLDQYLAIKLTNVVEVVTDPTRADAILTDRIGANFEKTMEEVYQKKDRTAKEEASFTKPSMQPLSRGKGSVFLVDRNTRSVLWSIYAKPKNTQADELNNLAGKIVKKLQKDRTPKAAK